MSNDRVSSNRVSKRTPAVAIGELPGSLPKSQIPADTDCEAVARAHLPRLLSLSVDHVTDSVIWRDLLALTGTFRTFYSAPSVTEAWTNTFGRHGQVDDLQLTPGTAKVFSVLDASSWIDAQFTFHASPGGLQLRCSGFISLVPTDNKGWKIWMIRTILDEVADYGNVDVLDPVVPHIKERDNGLSQHFDALVIGGGQAGLGIGGRLQALNVSYLVVDKFDSVGDSWNTRYDSTKRHLPFYRTYDDSYPEFLTKADIAKGHKDYVKRFGINIWQSTELISSSWSTQQKIWTCRLIRGGEEVTVTAFHLVFAGGSGGRWPMMPSLPNREQFKGIVLHSSDYQNSNDWRGLHGVVVGSANTGHDVAEDMLNAGVASVTMVQRDVLPAEHYMAVTKAFYNLDIPTEKADGESFSFPASIRRQIILNLLHAMARDDSERFDALQKAGFDVERYGDLMHILFERLGGHYMDVGASAKISDGSIKVKSGSSPTHYTATGLAFDDGTELEADVIVFTTGFVGNLRQIAGRIVGPEIADQLDDFWRVDAEGELRGAFKYAGHPGLWFTGGDIGIARYYGRFIALQIKAHLMGTPLRVYDA
ncbi:Flavin-binding monooxygenase-like family protein [Fonsecaea pedrosoi]|nr:Flavin-binding monooxygenase-like family protein [Fonsecaea pedrosoi]